LISYDLREKFGIRVQLHKGRLTIYFEPVAETLRVGNTFTVDIGLQDDSMPKPVQDRLTIRVVDEEKEEKRQKAKTKEKSGAQGQKEGAGSPAPTHGLPRYVLLTKDGRMVGDQETRPWPEGFTEHDGGMVEDLGEEGVLYKINYDNSYHLKYRLQQRGDVARDVVTEKFILGMRILMLGYEHAFRTLKEANGGDANGFAEYADQFRRMAARGASATVLALAENLPRIIDKSTINAGQEVE
jgi:hypothetical protein